MVYILNEDPMSLDVHIKYPKPKNVNYFASHPYSYNDLSEADRKLFELSEGWSGNITHNLGRMANQIPVGATTLYYVCWRPEEIGLSKVKQILPLLIEGIHYMLDHRKELEKYNPSNGWGSYNVFMKFLLNYKQACEDSDPESEVSVGR